ncbi:replication initiation factor domain-containing protein [Macrococcus brunensis]|uniref:replication initiation factor domain-containing protein n=1 Tax=Macrococcus brunensis TaxID=198483 RepID=UPI001EF01745|nr:replication initiation factor domain-containing protein [Macrococcus brunensis]ULG73156.1 replication initiation factor domain-containing protein [Macrococcus brunensis]
MDKEQLEENWEPALSNSRLEGCFANSTKPKVSFDRMTIIGDLPLEHAQYMADTLGNDLAVELWEKMNHKFKGKVFNGKIYIEHDRLKADAWDRRNFRIEFNPNNLVLEEKEWIRQKLLIALENIGFTRLDLAFDFEEDLSDYFVMSDYALKKTIFYGKNGKAETKYFGVRDSDRFIRIYNKKQERKDVAEIEMEQENLWRFEIELKRKKVDEWNNNCFDDMHILKPEWATIENINDQAMIFLLLHEESKWGELKKTSKYKYKKMIKEISPINLVDFMKLALRENESELQKQIDFWLS